VLAWCLGQHPNILPVPESNWMGDFAMNVAVGYQVGAARGNLSILSAMEITPAAFFANFGQSINELILAHRSVLEQKRKFHPSSKRKHAVFGPKVRWVDGTPEYSFHICGLRKLFPTAVFIHLVRDVDSVVRSLLNFHRVSGAHLVANEEEAYKYWLRTVKACLKAEEAYGPHVVHRLLYSTLINKSESAIQSLLSFVGESYSPMCLEPLGERINSSNVPPDFKSDDTATDPAIVEEARRLWVEIKQTEQSKEPSAAAADELEMAFQGLCLRRETIEQELTNHIERQEEHYTAAIARLEQNYENRLAKQLREIRQLVGMLDALATIDENLRSSRFWRLAHRAAAIEAKLFSPKKLVSRRPLQEIISNYSRWRASHPDIADLDEPVHRTESPASGNDSDTRLERPTSGTAKVSKNSAKT
jgi:hypothetical protein